MNKEYFTQVLGYQSAMAQARVMLSCGMISWEEYGIFEAIIAEKYGLSACSIFRDNDLIYSEVRGNMSHYEGVTTCQEQ